MQSHGFGGDSSGAVAWGWREKSQQPGGSSLWQELARAVRIGETIRMSSVAQVAIHASQFPEAVRRDLLESLRTRRVNHKFHYDSVKQTQKWLALHQAFSPSRHDPDCAAIYDQAFAGVGSRLPGTALHLVGLGCGGGQKDTRLLRALHARGVTTDYTPCDVSAAMVLVARAAALAVVPEGCCHPLVCDLTTAQDLGEVLRQQTPAVPRLLTFFGMIPNFEPAVILPRLAAWVQPADWLLFSANLAPGDDYAAGMQRILPQYDNSLTREWLLTFLLDLGVERSDGSLRFAVEEVEGLKRVAARFHFEQPRQLKIEAESFAFQPGDVFQLFFSYRYQPTRVRALLQGHGLLTQDCWIARSGEEGVFLCRRA